MAAHDLFAKWIYAAVVVGAGLFFFLFLRQKQCAPIASLLGAVVYCYGSCNFSLVHAGHLGKFGNYLWFAATLWALEHTFTKPKSWSWRIATGLFLGWTVCEQPDVAILFVWLFVVYLAFRFFSQIDLRRGQAAARFFLGMLALSGLISGLVAADVVLSQYKVQVAGIVQVNQENKEQSWNWATQWSYPPGEETLEMVLPGFYGWGIDNPDGPYWGRTGRSPQTGIQQTGIPQIQTRHQFPRDRPEYLWRRSWPVFAFPRRFGGAFDPPWRKEIRFWAIVALTTLLLLRSSTDIYSSTIFFMRCPR